MKRIIVPLGTLKTRLSSISSYFAAGTLVVGLAGVGLGDAPPLGFGFGGVVGAGVTLMAVIISRFPR